MVSVGHPLDELIGAGGLAGGDTLLLRGIRVAPAQVFQDGAREQGVLLQHHGHLIAQSLHVILTHVQAAHPDRPLVHIVQPADQVDQAALA